MDYTTLGQAGLQVSRLCLGTMTFGRESNKADSYQMLDRFMDAGGNFIDTADAYSNGDSEKFVGEWLKGKTRHDVVLATKVRFGDGLNNRGLSRKHILTAVEGSLRRLNTEYIDLYQLHMWDASTPLEETLSTLNDLVRSGKVLYLGISNFSGWQLQKAVDLCHAMGWSPISCLQPLYNLLDREAEWELIPASTNAGLGVIPWSPLRGGWLSGKFTRSMSAAPQKDTRIKMNVQSERTWTEEWTNYDNAETWHVIDTLISMAQEISKSPPQIALNWLLQRPGVSAPIIGARTMEQLEDNLGAAGWSLSMEQMERLNRASDKRLPYPYELLGNLRQV